MERDKINEGQMWLLLIVIGWVVLWLCCCKSVEYVPVKVIEKDSVYLTTYVRDSVYVESDRETITRNDTVYVTKTLYKYKEKVTTDTMYIERVDSVEVPYPVARALTKWERTRIDWGGWAMLIVVVLSIVIVWLVRSGRK